MLRDVFVASIDKGQFPIAAVSVICLAMIIKMPDQEVARLVYRLLDEARSFCSLGWDLSMVIAAGGYRHSQSLRRHCAAELARVTSERNNLQKQALGSHRIRSSET